VSSDVLTGVDTRLTVSRDVTPHTQINIAPYLLKARIVGLEKQPLLANGSEKNIHF
jgi:hypothetical protein